MQKENTPLIITERLILRKFEESDAQALLDILSCEEVNLFLPWFTLKNLDDALLFLKERFLKYYEMPCSYRYAVCLKSDNKPIGYVVMSSGGSNDIGYALKKEFWRKGIAFEAANAVVNQLKNAGYTYITATHDIKNPNSGKVMQKLGMIYKYSYVEQWQPKNIPVTFRMYQLNFDSNNDYVYMKYWNKSEVRFIEDKI